jgi:hypothetical protein
MNPYAVAVAHPRRMLTNLLAWLDKAEAHAKARGFDPECYVECRLTADMFPLRRQVQSACDGAKLGAARAAGREAPTHADDEKTLAELRARVATVIAFLDTFTPADFDGASDRIVTLPFLPPGKGMRTVDYLTGFAMPNFTFHVVTAYGILRANGVELGKRDFLGGLDLVDV